LDILLNFSLMVFNATFNNISVIRVITKLPNTEQSSKGKGKTQKSTNRQNQSTTGKLGKPQRNGGLNQILRRQTSRFHYG